MKDHGSPLCSIGIPELMKADGTAGVEKPRGDVAKTDYLTLKGRAAPIVQELRAQRKWDRS